MNNPTNKALRRTLRSYQEENTQLRAEADSLRLLAESYRAKLVKHGIDPE